MGTATNRRWAPSGVSTGSVTVGAVRRLRLPAAEVSLGRRPPEDTTILNALPARILDAEADGAQMAVRLRLGDNGAGAVILSRVSRLSWDRLALQPGETVFARIKAVALAGASH